MNEKELKEKLDEEIASVLSNVSRLCPGSEEKKEEINNLERLYKLKLEEDKLESEKIDMEERRKTEAESKKQQVKEQFKDRVVKIGIAAAEIILPLCLYARWMKKGFEFEKNGSITSLTFKNLLGKIKPTRK